MFPLKHPKTVLLLTVVFAWSLTMAVDLLLHGPTTADQILYQELGLGWLGASLIGMIAVLDLGAVRYLVRPQPVGIFICLSSIALSALQNSLGFFLAHSYPEVARRAVVMATQLRGVKMSAESIDAVMDPNLWLLTWSGSLVISLALVVLVRRNVGWFMGRTAAAGEQA